jgi:ribonuclease HI
MPKHDPNMTICIYTDGSGINSNIGAAAYCPTTTTTSHQYLRKDTFYNVYAAELSGIYQATNIAKNSPKQLSNCIIYSDSQAAISTTVKPGRQSGQSIIKDILDSVDDLQMQRPELTISIVWIPGHEDIPGNEAVNVEAKKAAQSGGAPNHLHTPQ